MKNININPLIQLLGMLGVIGSLIFVGLEMRQSHRFALAGHYEARTNSLLNIVSSFTEGEAGYGDMVRAALGDRIEVEKAHLNGIWQLWFLWENDFMQYELGLMDEAAWTAKLGAMQTAYNACGFRDETDLALNFMVPGMVELVEESFEDHCVN